MYLHRIDYVCLISNEINYLRYNAFCIIKLSLPQQLLRCNQYSKRELLNGTNTNQIQSQISGVVQFCLSNQNEPMPTIQDNQFVF